MHGAPIYNVRLFHPSYQFCKAIYKGYKLFPPIYNWFVGPPCIQNRSTKGSKDLGKWRTFSCCSTQPQWQMKVQVWDPILKIYLEPETSTSKLVVSNWMMNQVFYHGKMVVSTKHPVNTMVVWSSRPLSCSQFFYSELRVAIWKGKKKTSVNGTSFIAIHI